MTKLTKIQLGHLQGLLNERAQRLQGHLAEESAAKDDFVEVASEVPDPGDSSFATLTIDLGNAAVGRDMTGLRAIEAAWQRMHSGEYGACVECGYDIPYERLMAQPTAARCAPCQHQFERTHAEAGARGTM